MSNFNQKQIIETKELTGRGIEAKIEDKIVLAGNRKLMQERNIDFSKCEDYAYE